MTARATTGPTCTLALAILLSGTTLVAQPPEASRSPEAGDPKRGTVQANGITIAYERHGPEDRERGGHPSKGAA